MKGVIERFHGRKATRCTPTTSCEVHSNKPSGVASEGFATERTNGRGAGRGFFNYGQAAIGTQNMSYAKRKKNDLNEQIK